MTPWGDPHCRKHIGRQWHYHHHHPWPGSGSVCLGLLGPWPLLALTPWAPLGGLEADTAMVSHLLAGDWCWGQSGAERERERGNQESVSGKTRQNKTTVDKNVVFASEEERTGWVWWSETENIQVVMLHGTQWVLLMCGWQAVRAGGGEGPGQTSHELAVRETYLCPGAAAAAAAAVGCLSLASPVCRVCGTTRQDSRPPRPAPPSTDLTQVPAAATLADCRWRRVLVQRTPALNLEGATHTPPPLPACLPALHQAGQGSGGLPSCRTLPSTTNTTTTTTTTTLPAGHHHHHQGSLGPFRRNRRSTKWLFMCLE
ncbi:hypothetical protein E2C01_012984 [Portunus trituberculatus]|uniref:Uncharacterized protein n=1 Tax=Portunus trituberculatus TaxID=210409 RepID=A0A5B7DF16_PORTR|nr:hypothetical protein [Portunus trituberculatus]